MFSANACYLEVEYRAKGKHKVHKIDRQVGSPENDVEIASY